MFKPSRYNLAVFDAIKNPKGGNLLIEAVAGSGKSTTLIEGLKLTKGYAIMLAFNKAIVEDLKTRVPGNTIVSTFHSLCYAPVRNALHFRRVDTNKLWNLQMNWTPVDVKRYGAYTRKLVSLAKSAGIGAISPIEESSFYALAEYHDLELEVEGASEARAVELTMRLLEASNQSREVDFDDLLYLPILMQLNLPKYDWVFCDEAQDTNAIQREILRKILGRTGRGVFVGDRAQSIYLFRGADSTAMDLIAEEFDCHKLPLSITYRCPLEVVKLAKQYVPTIEAAEGAIPGEAIDLGEKWKLEDLGSHDLVVCRNNKPLISLGYKLFRAKIPVRILGRDIGDGLKALARKCDDGSGELDKMIANLEKWREREVAKAEAKNNMGKVAFIEDKVESLLFLTEDIPEGKRYVSEVLDILEILFTADNSRVTLATVHKAKGLEADVVWWLGKSLCPSKYAKLPHQLVQEKNIQYIAVTRAKKKLVMIELGEQGGKKAGKGPTSHDQAPEAGRIPPGAEKSPLAPIPATQIASKAATNKVLAEIASPNKAVGKKKTAKKKAKAKHSFKKLTTASLKH